MSKKYICENCGTEVKSDIEVCPNCTAIFENPNEESFERKKQASACISIILIVIHWIAMLSGVLSQYDCEARGDASCMGILIYIGYLPIFGLISVLVPIKTANNYYKHDQRAKWAFIALTLLPLYIFIIYLLVHA